MEQLKKLPGPLLDWYAENKRDLPWRRQVSPYGTWVSEIMLQQTRVSAVLPYFQRFTETCPTVEALAEISPEELMRLWQGLGYYSRARNLQRAARIIVEEYGGVFPDTYEKVRALPGIGDYTAGAILSIAMGQDVPAVDGNVLRLVSRITGCRENVLDDKVRKKIRAMVEEILPEGQAGLFNQAMMDLGAGICLPKGEPLCGQCPAREFCIAKAESLQSVLPVREKSGERRSEKRTVFVLRRGDEVALCRRAEKGLLAGLWEYPNVEGELSEQAAAEQLEAWHIIPHLWDKKIVTTHTFTHIRWEMTGYIIQVMGNGKSEWTWADRETRGKKAIPSAFARFTEEIDGGERE